MFKKIISIILATTISFSTFSALAIGEEKLVNVALNKPSKASSIMAGWADSSFLFDGNAATIWSAVDGDATAWSQVDLGAEYKIDTVEILARTDDADQPGTRKNFEVLGSNYIDFSEFDVLITAPSSGFPHKGSLSEKVDSKNRYRFIRLARTTGEYFCMADMKVFVSESEMNYVASNSVTANNISFVNINTENINYAEFLSSIGVISPNKDGEIDGKTSITKAQSCVIITKILGMNTNDFTYEPYSDVDDNLPQNREIAACYANNIISHNTIFEPEKQVTLLEFTKMLLKAMGYGEYCENTGGYPNGYLGTAQSLKLFANIDNITEHSINLEEAILLTYNAITTKTLAVIGTGYKGEQHKEDEMLLTKTFSIYKNTGIVSSDETTSLNDSKNVMSKNKVKIGSDVLTIKFDKIDNYFGYNVNYFYEMNKESDEKKVVFAFAKKNEVVQIYAKDIATFNTNYISYNEDNKLKTIKFTKKENYLYNGVAIDSAKDDYFQVKEGFVTLIDNTNDGDYDVISIVKTIDYVVDFISYKDKKIVTKGNKNILLDDKKDFVKIVKNGQNVDFNDISVDDVISVAQSDNSNKNKSLVYISDKKAQGCVTEILEDAVVIDYDEKINLSKNFSQNLVMDNTYKYFLNYENKISYIDAVDSFNEQYAYFLKAEISDGLNKQLKMKLFTSNGKVKIYDVTKKFILDGVAMKNTQYNQVIMALTVNGEQIPQPIRVTINTDLKITMIDTLVQNPIESTDKNSFAKTTYNETNGYFKTDSQTFNGKILIDNDTVVINVPIDQTQDEDFSVGSITQFEDGTLYDFTAYGGGGLEPVKVLLVPKGVDTEKSYNSPLLIIDSKIKALNEQGEEVTGISGFVNGRKMSYKAKDNKVFNGIEQYLNKGNIIRFSLNNSGYIETALLVCDISGTVGNKIPVTVGPGENYKTTSIAGNGLFNNNITDSITMAGNLGFAFTCAYDIKNGMLELKLVNKDNVFIENVQSILIKADGKPITVYEYSSKNPHNGKIYSGNMSDIVTFKQCNNLLYASNVFFAGRRGGTSQITVYNKID